MQILKYTLLLRFNQDNLIKELDRNNLKTELVTQLKNRRITYLRGESTQNYFELIIDQVHFIFDSLLTSDNNTVKKYG